MASKEQLEGIYDLLSKSYSANWQYRWRDTPYLKNATAEGKKESVAGHVWGAMEYWFQLRRICPHLNSLVNTAEIYEIVLNHDLGETDVGDTPLYRKIKGAVDSRASERDGLVRITDHTPEVQAELLSQFDEFEQDIEKIDKLEFLIAKWLDSLQGNHFALTFGNSLPEYSGPINKILQIRFVAYTNRLMDVLKERNEIGAVDEVKDVARHHTNVIRAAGIDFDTSGLEI